MCKTRVLCVALLAGEEVAEVGHVGLCVPWANHPAAARAWQKRVRRRDEVQQSTAEDAVLRTEENAM